MSRLNWERRGGQGQSKRGIEEREGKGPRNRGQRQESKDSRESQEGKENKRAYCLAEMAGF